MLPSSHIGEKIRRTKVRKKGVCWDKGSLVSEAKLYKQKSKIRNSVTTLHQQTDVGPCLGKLINVT